MLVNLGNLLDNPPSPRLLARCPQLAVQLKPIYLQNREVTVGVYRSIELVITNNSDGDIRLTSALPLNVESELVGEQFNYGTSIPRNGSKTYGVCAYINVAVGFYLQFEGIGLVNIAAAIDSNNQPVFDSRGTDTGIKVDPGSPTGAPNCTYPNVSISGRATSHV